MKTTINDDKGVVTTVDGSGLDIQTAITAAAITAPSGSFTALNVNGLPKESFAFENRWDDLFGTFDQGTGASVLTFENFRDTGFPMLFMSSIQNDSLSMRYQMPHGWNRGPIIPHMHVVPCAAPAGVETVLIGWQACWIPAGSTFPGASGWITGSVSLQVSASMQYVNNKISFGTFTPPLNAGNSTEFFIKIVRSGSSSADTYTSAKPDGTGAANLGILHVDCDYQKITAGSITEY